MKMTTTQKLTSLFLLLPFFVFSQIRNIDAGIYKVKYDEGLENPLYVEYTILCPTGNASRKGMDFYKVDSVHTADNEDYKFNVWDKGHMAPAADFNCDREMLYKTFSYLNSSLQHKSLNRGEWKELEKYERELSLSEGPVNVEIEVIFDENPPRVPAGAAIPKSYKKHIITSSRTLCYYFLNEEPVEQGFDKFQIKCQH